MKLQLRDRQAELDGVVAQDPLEIIQRSMDTMVDEEDEELLLWIRPTHLDDEQQRPDPTIAQAARAQGVNVERVLSEEVGSSNSSASDDSDDGTGGHGGDTGGDIGSGGGGGGYYPDYPHASDADYRAGSSQGGGAQYTPWTEEEGFTHATQDMDHGAREMTYDSGSYDGQGYGRGTMSISGSDIDQMSLHLGSLSLTPDGSEASVPYYQSQPDFQYQPVPLFDFPPPVLVLRGGQRTITLADGRQEIIRSVPGYPFHNIIVGCSQYQYDMHLQTYLTNYIGQMSWYDYCLIQTEQPHMFQEPRHSTWN